jgi:acyl carrier protein
VEGWGRPVACVAVVTTAWFIGISVTGTAGVAPYPKSKYNSAFRNLAAWACRRKPPDLQPDKHFSMPDYNEFLQRIFAIVKPFAKQGIILNENSELVTELGLTSLQVMELIEQIEDHFDMSIPLNILPDIRTIHDLAEQLEKLSR